MASVLEYIYHGEVAVPTGKLDFFFDTVKAMEIYMDQRYITAKGDYLESRKRENIDENIPREKFNVCQPILCQNHTDYCINVKGGMNIANLLCHLQQSLRNSTLRDNTPGHRSWSYENIPDLENLKSQTGLRQRQSFVRDIFIETYTQNGNGNGLKAGVLAILNEHYRLPTSVLPTNANGNHLSANDTPSNTSERTTYRNSHITSGFHSFIQLQQKLTENDDTHMYNVANKLEPNNYYTDCTLRKKYKGSNKISGFKSNTTSSVSSQFFPINSSFKSFSDKRCSMNNNHRKDISHLNFIPEISTGFDFSVVKHSCKIFDEDKLKDAYKMIGSRNRDAETNRPITKVAILNKVSQSPWHPRLPDSYKPFRKKNTNVIQPEINNVKKVMKEQSNDNANNEDTQTGISTENNISFKEIESKCSICQQVFTTIDGYDVHMRRHSSISRYSCGECHKTFSQLRNFKYHMSIHRGTKEFAATCPVCGKYFNDRGYLSSHMKIHKNRKEYKCPSCPKSFNQRVAYNMHVRIHTGVKPHVCEECGKAFSRKMLLKQHQRTHSGERPYACALCDKRFADRSNMTLHLRLHTGVKPFSCSLCSKSFTKKHHLKAHLNFHTGAKPYSCPRCKLAFTQSSNMRTHYKKCSTIKGDAMGELLQDRRLI